MISVSLLLMTRPSPVPPYLLVVDAPTWLKARNRRSRRSAGMPHPVSRTAKCSEEVSAVPENDVTVSVTSPDAVNFTALPNRLTRICRSRVTSPRIQRGRMGSMATASSSFFSAARTARRSTESSTHFTRSNG